MQKILVLTVVGAFLSAEATGLTQVRTVQGLQDQAQVLLGEYIRHQYGGSQPTTRFGKLLLALPCLRLIPAQIVSQMFFEETVGSIPVEKLLCDIYESTILSNGKF